MVLSDAEKQAILQLVEDLEKDFTPILNAVLLQIPNYGALVEAGALAVEPAVMQKLDEYLKAKIAAL